MGGRGGSKHFQRVPYPENSTDPAELKKYADFAMLPGEKDSEKESFGEFDLALYNQADYTTQVRREFHKVVDESLLKYRFQPIISAVTGETEAYEALMRAAGMPHCEFTGHCHASGKRRKLSS